MLDPRTAFTSRGTVKLTGRGTVKLTKTSSLDPQHIGVRRICERGILCRGFDTFR